MQGFSRLERVELFTDVYWEGARRRGRRAASSSVCALLSSCSFSMTRARAVTGWEWENKDALYAAVDEDKPEVVAALRENPA